MDCCKACGWPGEVMGNKVVNGKQVYAKVPFKKNQDAKGFTCGLCVAHGYLKPKAKQETEANLDLKELRKARGITQTELAHSLMVSRVQVSKVESGQRVMPSRWMPILEKMYPNHAIIPDG